MGLGIGWWTGLGEASRWTHDWTGWAGQPTVISGHVRLSLSGAKFYQRPYTSGGSGGQVQSEPGWDIGFFYLLRTHFPQSEDFNAMAVDTVGVHDAFGVTIYQPQWVELTPQQNTGALNPPYSGVAAYYVGTYKTGFISDRGGPHLILGTTNHDTMIWFRDYPGVFCRMYHYNPWAWFGTVPEVIASIVMKSGLDSSFIDTVAFDTAFDAYDLATGDAPWTTGTTKWEVHCWRKVGQKVIDLIMDVMRHSRDLFYIDERGRMSCSSYTRPDNVLASLDYSDGVIDQVSWFWSMEYLYNSLNITFGAATKAFGKSASPPSATDFSAVDEPQLESYQGNNYRRVATRTTSIDKYGEIGFGNKLKENESILVNYGGAARMINTEHYPFLLSTHGITNASHLAAFMNSDGKPRRIIEVKQDLRGLNYAIGDEVQNVALTSDGATIPVTRCISKKYDFNTLTVVSVLMEIPDNSTLP